MNPNNNNNLHHFQFISIVERDFLNQLIKTIAGNHVIIYTVGRQVAANLSQQHADQIQRAFNYYNPVLGEEIDKAVKATLLNFYLKYSILAEETNITPITGSVEHV